jgi:homocysteine S-methyltransferase
MIAIREAMRDPIKDFLARRPMLVLDGALATELERRGADLLDPLWSAKCLIEQPDLIRAVHFDYFRAGADVATTATYQATFQGFERRGLDRGATAALMRFAVSLAAAARILGYRIDARRPAASTHRGLDRTVRRHAGGRFRVSRRVCRG